MTDLFDKLRPVAERLQLFAGGAVPFDTVIDEVLGPCEVVIQGIRVLMCGSNNYLGLSWHPDVMDAARDAIAEFGTGTTGSRVANGTLALHRALERDFATAYGKAHAMVFTTGYQANLGLIAGLCGADDTIVLDAESHASIYDGARLSGAQMFAFRHNAVDDLERKLARQSRGKRTLVIVEGLYSIRGDIAPLKGIVTACRKTGACLLVDEAHSFGVYGPQGLGCAEAQDVLSDVDFLVGTFSKTLGGVGGFCVSDHSALKRLHFTSRSYLFSASGTPSTIAGVRAALAIVQRDTTLRENLWVNVRRMRDGLSRLGYRIGATESPIVAVEIGSAERTVQVWQRLLEAGLYVNIVLPPACRADGCLLRTSYSAAHTAEHLDRALEIFGRVGRDLAIIESAA